MKLKCYHKERCYKIPKINCQFCNRHIRIGEYLYTVVLYWGNGKSACKECYDMYKVDHTMRDESTEKKSENQKPIEVLNEKDFML